jgi:Domain of unknown function (DUF4279)
MSSDSQAYKIVTRLIVLDFECDAQLITATLGVQPTSTWKVGESVHPKAINVHHQNGWMKESPVDRCRTTPEESVGALLPLFPDLSAFTRLPQGSHVQLTLTLYAYKERPYFFLSSRYVAQLAMIRADLDVDIYDLSDVAETSTEAKPRG